MNRICWTILALGALLIGRADAQVAPQAVIGYQSLSCGTGPAPCFIPYGSSLPTTPGAPAGVTAVTATARGISLTTGGVDQTIAAASATRKALVIQNPCSATSQGIAAAENVFVNINAAATVSTNVNFAELAPCQSVTLMISPGYVDQEAIHVIAATTGHVIYAKEF